MYYLRATLYIYFLTMLFQQEVALIRATSALHNAEKRVEELSRTRSGRVVNNAYVCYSGSNKAKLIKMLEE